MVFESVCVCVYEKKWMSACLCVIRRGWLKKKSWEEEEEENFYSKKEEQRMYELVLPVKVNFCRDFKILKNIFKSIC